MKEERKKRREKKEEEEKERDLWHRGSLWRAIEALLLIQSNFCALLFIC